MELMAVIRGLEHLGQQPREVTVTTDSRYVHDASVKGWILTWQKNGWRTAAKQPVKNQDLWIRMLQAVGNHCVEWRWVKAHSNHPENEMADQLAVAAMMWGFCVHGV